MSTAQWFRWRWQSGGLNPNLWSGNDMSGKGSWGFDFRTILGIDDWWSEGWDKGARRRKRRQQVFEPGEIRFVILRLLREKPRHGYDIIKALEERFAGYYTPSAGTVYPTLQLLEDQGLVRAIEQEGRKVYVLTAEGARVLEENSQTLEDILSRVQNTIRGLSGGRMADLNTAFAKLATVTFRGAWRGGPDHPALGRVIDVLRRAVDEIQEAWDSA